MWAVLSIRNLLHDRVSLALVAGGVAVAIVLVHVQVGLFLGFQQMTGAVITHAGGQLWIVPKGTSNFDDPAGVLEIEPVTVAATAGVHRVRPLVAGFARWQAPSGENTSVIVIGTTPASDAMLPWSLDSAARLALDRPDGVVADQSYRVDLGIKKIGDRAHIETQPARVTELTSGIRSFTTSPYVFTRIDRARGYLGLGSRSSTYLVVDLEPGMEFAKVQANLAMRLRRADVLTTDEFLALNASHWLFSTGAGAALLSGAILGMLVGAAIVAQTLYAGTKSHLQQYVTLRALGARSRYLVRVVLLQACASGLIGYGIALIVGIAIGWATTATAMPVVMSWPMAGFLLLLTLILCGGSAVGAIIKVTQVDPMVVFSR